MPGTLVAVLFLLASSSARAQPLADHHQHLFSPELAALISGTPPARPIPPITAADLIRHLDDAGIKRSAVLSTAYIFGQPTRKVENEWQKLIADNDWTAAQVALYPGRLVGFCGLSPLEDQRGCAPDQRACRLRLASPVSFCPASGGA